VKRLFVASCALLVACAEAAPPPVTLGDPLPAGSPLLPARLRRLTNAEYARTAELLLGVSPIALDGFVPDVRQSWFSRNDALVVDAMQASALDAVAKALAKDAAPRASELLSCANGSDPECVREFLLALAWRAFRRPPSEEQLSRLLGVFASGAEQRDSTAGIELAIASVLSAPSLLYVTELGGAEVRPGVVALSEHELGAELAYLISGGPPDDLLLEAAERGTLSSPDEREAQLRRLLGQSETRLQFRRFVREWLGLDELLGKAKSSQLFPEFPAERAALLAETEVLIDEVMTADGASAASLLRAGILEQRSFLATHAHAETSSPVQRGVVVLERVTCQDLPRPGELGIEVVPPLPDPSKTTRELLQAHLADPACRACHDAIDGAGFAFEGFDAAGYPRSTDNGLPVDTSGSIRLDGAQLSFDGSRELSALLADSQDVRRCWTKQALRFAAATTDTDMENAFAAEQTDASLIEVLVAFVRSELFVLRRLP
jgi:hypothetical protein